MITQINRARDRAKIHYRIRRKISGTSSRPRLCVFRSLKHIYAQIIDDLQGKTLVAASTLEKKICGDSKGTGAIHGAKLVGEAIAERAKAKGVEAVVFDRGGYIYHGRVKALADAARAKGLKF